MTENEAIEKIKYRMHTAEHVAGECGMEDLEMAIKALEEVQRWHTSEINPNIKNEFANTSTQICHNCDHKDEYIEELEAEVEEYRAIGTPEECKKSVAVCKAMIARKITPENMEEYMKFEDECVKNGFTFDSLLKAREKQTAKKVKSISKVKDGDSYVGLIGRCPCCGDILEEDTVYCDCGQRLDWGTSDEID